MSIEQQATELLTACGFVEDADGNWHPGEDAPDMDTIEKVVERLATTTLGRA
jgi:hypothetical protein